MGANISLKKNRETPILQKKHKKERGGDVMKLRVCKI